MKKLLLAWALLLLCLPANAHVQVPFSFTPGTKIQSSQVNADFNALVDEINSHEVGGSTINTFAPVANQFLTGFDATGTFSAAQPAFSNLSGTATTTQGGLGASFASSTGALVALTGTVTAVNGSTTGNVLVSDGTTWKSGPIPYNIKTKTADYLVSAFDDLILARSAAIQLTLFSATQGFKDLRVQKIGADTNPVIVAAQSGEAINGATSFILNTQFEEATLRPDGNTNWYVTSRTYPQVWTTYTMTIGGSSSAPTKGTGVADLAQWRRIGDDSMQIRYQYAQTSNSGAANGSGTYLFPLPSPYKIDTNKQKVSTSHLYSCGSGAGSDKADGVSSQASMLDVSTYDSGNLALYQATSSTTMAALGSANFNLGNAGAVYNFTCIVPIAGWK